MSQLESFLLYLGIELTSKQIETLSKVIAFGLTTLGILISIELGKKIANHFHNKKQ